MSFTSLLCVTRCSAPASEIVQMVRSCDRPSVTTGETSCVTGAMLFTGDHLVEVIEIARQPDGSPGAHVTAHPDRAQVVFVEQRPIGQRRFPDWSTAYAGPSQFVSAHVTRLLSAASPADKRRAADQLADLVYEFMIQSGKA